MFVQIIEALWAGVKVGFHAIFSIFPLYEQLSGIKTEIIAAALGIPVIVLTIIGILIKVVKVVVKH